MSEGKKPPAFYCPECGQKHRADLSDLVEAVGSVMRLACVGCKIPLAVSLGEGRKPICKRDEPTTDRTPPPKPVSAKPPPVKKASLKKASLKKASAKEAPAPQSSKSSAPVTRKKRGKQGKATAGAKKAETAGGGAPAAPSEPAKAPAPEDAASATEVIDAEFGVGDHIGRYAIEKVIGQGGCSTVYQAFDPTTNRSVALKALKSDAAEGMASRFLREIEVQANIRHQNIMPVFDRGTLEDGRPFFTMELLYNPWTLSDVVRRRDEGTLARYATMKKFGEIEALVKDVIVPISDGIYVANVENGVIHRDLKPDNVLIDTRTGRPYVIDFGICHVLEKKSGFASKAVIPPTTEDEGIVGTPRYLPPEQVKGSVHARTDVWGLGAMLHYVVSGEPPIAGASNISRSELRRRIEKLEHTKKAAVDAGDERKIDLCDEQLVRLTDPSLRTVDDLFKDAKNGVYSELSASTPAPLKAVIDKAMAASTSDRYVNARQLGKELSSWLGGDKVRALSEAGGKAAAVETARRAVRTHLVTLVWLLVGLGLGVLLAYALAKPGDTPASTRVADAEQDIELLKQNLDGLRRVAENLTAVERNRLWQSLDERANQIAEHLKKEPDVSSVQAVRAQLDYVRSIFAPPRVRIDVPADVSMTAEDLVTGTKVALKRGENQLPPGAYLVSGSGGLRFPLDVPLWIRNQQEAEKVALEAPLEILQVPVSPTTTPAGMVLVLGGRVLARDLPFRTPSTAATTVPAFFMDAAEVTNSEYAQFLASLPVPERKTHGPRVAFVPDPEQDGAPIVIQGLEGMPVAGVTPEDARAYAAWRSKKRGVAVRLPNEAEWVLAAGATMGYDLANGATGERNEAEFVAPLRTAGEHVKDVSPYGVKGLLGNAREMVTSYLEDLEDAAVLVKGAGVGDDPDQGAIYIQRVLKGDEYKVTTGFRCVQQIPGTEAPR